MSYAIIHTTKSVKFVTHNVFTLRAYYLFLPTELQDKVPHRDGALQLPTDGEPPLEGLAKYGIVPGAGAMLSRSEIVFLLSIEDVRQLALLMLPWKLRKQLGIRL